LEVADIGIMVLASNGHIRMISQSMARMLRAKNPVIHVSPLGQVRIREEAAQAVLTAMLKEHPQAPKVLSQIYGPMKLTFTSLKRDNTLLALEGPVIVILLQRADLHGQAFDQRHFAQAYRLTTAESRALAGIVAGKSIDQIAEEASVSRETIRSQVKSLYAKTGVRSMKDIVRLALARSPAL
jgi:DNA-binding CsgD family transcriptional regulator